MAIRFSRTFLLRKLHQLTGIVPLGIFFFVHMFTNSKAMNGHSATIVNRIPGMTMPGMNAEGSVNPRITGSNGGKIRRAPSSHPTYQSGWAGELTAEASNGP